MKTAKEMFEKLGYKNTTKDNIIYYFKEIHIPNRFGGSMFYHINFILKNKEIFVSKNLLLEEIRAINQQIKELGWDEN